MRVVILLCTFLLCVSLCAAVPSGDETKKLLRKALNHPEDVDDSIKNLLPFAMKNKNAKYKTMDELKEAVMNDYEVTSSAREQLNLTSENAVSLPTSARWSRCWCPYRPYLTLFYGICCHEACYEHPWFMECCTTRGLYVVASCEYN
eukprot:CAMPEP_0198725320 /NCGR_PEP_ID=MMETSP1475-20131203/2645_1 /TAXON_ID= ORGANISM="Unidentified sp., Strain CCMP1999" /NCGR_SAMPLE_ID=MMETSP1475 /ASSEMBLY_ACC=CAM_ASM_001111 /LENGTH=146 /DNA_ID=CAMNT_0044487069 /DNA_START=86 /DNA_END=526 /DNA_ORIENTATION=+